METDYFKLAEQYAGFLAALGGISITVLALVLAIGQSPVNPKAHRVLIVSLILATFSCFTGVHLMTETAALLRDLPSGKRSGLGPYLLSTVNTCIAPMLTGFSLMLLPRVYFEEKENQGDVIRIQWIADWVFYIVVGIAWFWAIYYFFARLNTPPGWWGWIIPILTFCARIWIPFYLFPPNTVWQKRWAKALFILLIVSIASPVAGFILVTDDNPPLLVGALLYYLAIMFSGAALLCLKPILFSKENDEFRETWALALALFGLLFRKEKDETPTKEKDEPPITDKPQITKKQDTHTTGNQQAIGKGLLFSLAIIGFAAALQALKSILSGEEKGVTTPSTQTGAEDSAEKPLGANPTD